MDLADLMALPIDTKHPLASREEMRRCWTAHAWTEWDSEGVLGLLQSRFCVKCGRWGLRRVPVCKVA